MVQPLSRESALATLQKTGDDLLQARLLADHMITLVRAFGLLSPDSTPCGAPLSISQAHALLELSSSDPLSQKELAKRLCLEKSTVSRLVGQLTQKGWIKPHQDLNDKRVLRLELTSAGRKIAQEIAHLRSAKYKDVISQIPKNSRQSMLQGLQILTGAIVQTNKKGQQ